MTTDTGDTGTSTEGGGQTETGDAGTSSWYSDYSEEDRGWLDNRGMLGKTAEEALAASIKGHRNAEQSLGVPQDRRIDLPADDSVDGAMDAVYNRLGRPEAADGYTFADADASGNDKAFDDWAKDAFHKAGLPAGNADALYSSFKEFIGNTVNQSTEDRAIQVEANQQELKRDWGATYDRNTNLANAAVNKMGLSPDQFDQIKEGLGDNDAMKLFQKIGAGFGEDAFVGDNDLGPGGPTTPEGAREEIKALKKDTGFTTLLRAGDTNAKKKWDALHVVGFSSPS